MIQLKGKKFGADDRGAWSGPLQQTLAQWKAAGQDFITYKVDFPTRGVWYVWLKVRCAGPWPALLTWDVDGVQPLLSARKDILVQPGKSAAWVNYSRFPGVRVEVNIDKPGEHLLRFVRKEGNAEIEKVILSLYFSAKLSGDTLDMKGDPGAGRDSFPQGALSIDGFRPDFRLPVIRSRRAYYVDSKTGDDRAKGTSPKRAWKTLDRVNAVTRFAPGDAILLKRGCRFNGGIAPKGSGTEKAPITLGAYGSGDRPLVVGIGRPGVALLDQSHWVIRDLAAASDPEYRQSAIALMVGKDAARQRNVRVANCVAFDSGRHGIEVGGEPGWDGVLVENCLAFHNSNDGICIYGGKARESTRNAVVRGCTTYSNPGMAGIWIHSAQNGLIERCLAYNNSCVNIWAWNAINITMRYCEAFRGRPQRDAAGFDIDWGCQACTFDHCYGHHNEGDAFLLMGSGALDFRGNPMHSAHNLVRWCVAEGHSPMDMGETFDHCLVHNNLSIASAPGSNAFKVFGWPNDDKGGNGGWPTGTVVANNIFVATKGAHALYVDDHGTDQGNVWENNMYYAADARGTLVCWGGRSSGPNFWKGDRKSGTFPPSKYRTLKEFQEATGQELGGVQANPRLPTLKVAGYGRLPLRELKPAAGSPAVGAGRPGILTPEWLRERRKWLAETGAEKWGIPMDPEPDKTDYWGAKLAGKWPIGPKAR